ncbi:DUF418 domain-containing protein [Cecembia rubra]|uniref:DUF418 domain-containing protein n=1 Tax=Cecembia rubra TaxID=1485585 RepID=UPI0027152C48|nr:DUF418 domain-containing protein [Cecembia rubra]
METLAPLSQSKRIDLVDSLRGFAIFGILMVNMPAFFKPAVELILLPFFGESTMEILSNGFIYFFFTGKFFVLFSLLFGLFGEIEVWQGILLVLAIFSFQISFSKWWLSKYRFGPMEWLWRTLTYGKIPEFKL